MPSIFRHLGLASVLLLAAGALRAQPTPGQVSTFAGAVGESGSTNGTGGVARFSYPWDVATDAAGNVYVADSQNYRVRQITPAGVVTTFAGGTFGTIDGTGTGARFSAVFGVAVDAAGNVYVSDNYSATIRKITPAGVVTTLAGLADNKGSVDGTGSAARFEGPAGLAVDAAGNIFVADTPNDTIRKITPAGVVTTFAGTAGSSAFVDGTGTAARFNRPRDVAIDASGNLYVADGINNAVRKITPAGVVTTFLTGSVLDSPDGVAVDASGNVWVASSGNHAIFAITPTGGVAHVAGSSGNSGSVDGSPLGARFYSPKGLAFDPAGNACVADALNHTIRRINAAPSANDITITQQPAPQSVVIGQNATFTVAATNGIATPLLFQWQRRAAASVVWSDFVNSGPYSGVTDPTLVITGATLAMSGDQFRCIVRNTFAPDVVSASATLTVTTGIEIIGQPTDVTTQSPAYASFVVTGNGPLPLSYQWQVSTDGANWTNLTDTGAYTGTTTEVMNVEPTDPSMNGWRFHAIVSDGTNPSVTSNAATLIVSQGYVFRTLAGNVGQPGSTDGTGTAAYFNLPRGIVRNTDGNFYVTDFNGGTIRRVTPAGVVTTFAGGGPFGSPGDGTGPAAFFSLPWGIAADATGNLYVADGGGRTIRKITPDAVVTTFAGSAAHPIGFADGTGSDARFRQAQDIAIDAAGNLFVADVANYVIRKITPAGVVTTFAGAVLTPGTADGPVATARFDRPSDLAFDSAGALFVVDSGNNTIRKISPTGDVTTFAGSPGQSGSADGAGAAARFLGLGSITIDANDQLYLPDGQTVRTIDAGGNVTTIGGTPGLPGHLDGPGAVALFNFPADIAVDAAGHLYVTDGSNHVIRTTTVEPPPGAPVITMQPQDYTTQVGNTAAFTVVATSTSAFPFTYRWQFRSVGSTGWIDVVNNGTLSGATTDTLSVNGATFVMSGDAFRCIVSNTVAPAAISSAATLTVASATITLAGLNRTYSGMPQTPIATTNPAGLAVTFTFNGTATAPTAVGSYAVVATINEAGNTASTTGTFVIAKAPLVARPFNQTRVRGYQNPVLGIYYTGLVGADTEAMIDALPVAATSANVASAAGAFPITLSGGSDDNYALTLINGTLTIKDGFTVRTLAGAFVPVVGPKVPRDGAGKAARFGNCNDVVLDAAGNALVADTNNHIIQRVTPEGVVTLFAGTVGVSGVTNGPALAARFIFPFSLAVDGAGNVFVGELYGRIRKISPAGVVSTFAEEASFPDDFTPNGMAVDAAGNVYVSGGGVHVIHKFTPAGVRSVFAGQLHFPGSADGTGGAARFDQPWGVAVDASGTVYVGERGNGTIRKISPAGVVTTLAGLAKNFGRVDGVGRDARFTFIHGIAVDASGVLFVSDGFFGGIVRRVTPDGAVSTIAGLDTESGVQDGIGRDARFSNVSAVAVSASGVVYVADDVTKTIRVGVEVASPPAITAQPQSVILTTNPPEVSFTVRATGAPPPGFQWQGSNDAGAPWADLADDATYANVTGPTLSVRNPNASMSGQRFRAVVNNIVTPQAVSAVAVLNVVAGGATFSGTFTPTGGAQPLRVAAASSTNGDWALFRRPDNTATFIAYLAASQSAIVLELTIAPDGTFSGNGATSVAANGAITNGAAFTLTGQIMGGVFSAQLTGLNVSLSGVLDATPGAAAQFAGLYSAAQLNASSGATYMIVGASGDAVIVALTPTGISGGLGTMNASGQLVAVLASGASFSASASAATLGFAAQITPAGSTSATAFAGLSSFVTPVNRLVNISTRGFVGSGAQSLIAGFVIAGPADKQVLVRAIGPTLAAFNLANPVADPAIEIVRQQNGVIMFSATNDNWGSAATSPAIVTASAQVSAFMLPDGSADSVLLSMLAPGAYTALARAQTGGNGVGLVEVYETPDTAASDLRLINISTRGQVNTGEQILIAGFVVTGNAPKKLLIRGIGPGLAPFFPVAEQSSLLVDPRLELFDGAQATIATNDDWGSGGDAALITSSSSLVQAFAIATGSKDAVLLLNLQPGSYTAHLTGVAATTGIAIAEVYEVP